MNRLKTRRANRFAQGVAAVATLAAFWVAAGAPLFTGV